MREGVGDDADGLPDLAQKIGLVDGDSDSEAFLRIFLKTITFILLVTFAFALV